MQQHCCKSLLKTVSNQAPKSRVVDGILSGSQIEAHRPPTQKTPPRKTPQARHSMKVAEEEVVS